MAEPPAPHLGLPQLRKVMEHATAPLRKMAAEQERLRRIFQRAFDESLAARMDAGVRESLEAFEKSFRPPPIFLGLGAPRESPTRDVSRPVRPAALGAGPAAATDVGRSPARSPKRVARPPNRKPHGKSPCERLKALWGTEEGALRILRAKNASEIAKMIGKGVTQTKASPFFKETIQPHRKWFKREIVEARRSRLTERGGI